MSSHRRFVIGGMIVGLCLGAATGMAQGNVSTGQTRRARGNFDPAQMQQRMLANVREQLAFTNDTEWAAVQPLVQKVLDARRDVMMPGLGRGRAEARPTGGSAAMPPQGGETRAGAFFKPSPEAEALQKVIDDKVPVAELRTVLEKYRASRKAKEAALAAAQDALRTVLTVRQEAQAALLGLVP